MTSDALAYCDSGWPEVLDVKSPHEGRTVRALVLCGAKEEVHWFRLPLFSEPKGAYATSCLNIFRRSNLRRDNSLVQVVFTWPHDGFKGAAEDSHYPEVLVHASVWEFFWFIGYDFQDKKFRPAPTYRPCI